MTTHTPPFTVNLDTLSNSEKLPEVTTAPFSTESVLVWLITITVIIAGFWSYVSGIAI